ncbi:MAG TPA: hypothetical protein VGN26_21340 [Armatimonadota bacterium]|jgi:hypothetical protein
MAEAVRCSGCAAEVTYGDGGVRRVTAIGSHGALGVVSWWCAKCLPVCACCGRPVAIHPPQKEAVLWIPGGAHYHVDCWRDSVDTEGHYAVPSLLYDVTPDTYRWELSPSDVLDESRQFGALHGLR